MLNKPIPRYQFPLFQPIHLEHFSLQIIGLHSKPDYCLVCGSAKIGLNQEECQHIQKNYKKILRKKVILCGCIVSGNDPNYKCVDCKTDFYKLLD